MTEAHDADETRRVRNIHVDRLEWLFERGMIHRAHHGAGRKLQRDRELASLGGYCSRDPALGVRTLGGRRALPSDVQCDAIRRINAARVHVGPLGFRIIEFIVLDGITLKEAARRLQEPVMKMPLALRVALDSLASFYGLA
jgi:hypothetical protein